MPPVARDAATATSIPFAPAQDLTPEHEHLPLPATPFHSTAFSATRHIVCLTLYNERATLLLETLQHLFRAIEQLYAFDPAADHRFAIVIIADGVTHVDPPVFDVLRAIAVLPAGICRSAGELECLATSSVPLSSVCGSSTGHHLSSTPPVDVTFCAKRNNAGKLDSHRLFFSHFCRDWPADYCHQIDVGTLVAGDAMVRAIGIMNEAPAVACLAPMISTAQPDIDASLLEVWQYFDFAHQAAVSWPAEVASGFLSVMPGQYSVFRSTALFDGTSSSSGKSSPVLRYLRGQQPRSVFERTMYLAEDRILGNEVILQRDRNWRLIFRPEAKASTDACANYGDLFRQRRRWTNGAAACRLWMLSQWPSYLAIDGRTIGDRLRFSLGMVWSIGLLLLQFFMPASFIIGTTALVHAANGSPGAVGPALGAVFASGFLAIVLSRLLPRPNRIANTLRLVRATCFWTGSILASFAILMQFGSAVLLAIVFPRWLEAALAITMLISRDRGSWPIVGWRYAEFQYVNMVLQPLMFIWGLITFHDLSWGTKGLKHGQGETYSRVARRARAALLVLALAANGSLVGWALHADAQGLLPNLRSALLVMGCVQGVMFAPFAIATWVSRIARGGSRPSRRHSGRLPVPSALPSYEH